MGGLSGISGISGLSGVAGGSWWQAPVMLNSCPYPWDRYEGTVTANVANPAPFSTAAHTADGAVEFEFTYTAGQSTMMGTRYTVTPEKAWIWIIETNGIFNLKEVPGWTARATSNFSFINGHHYTVVVTMEGDVLKAYVNGILRLTYTDLNQAVGYGTLTRLWGNGNPVTSLTTWQKGALVPAVTDWHRAGAAAGKIGVDPHFSQVIWPDGDVLATMQSLVAQGMTWVRDDLTWPDVQPNAGDWIWTKYDTYMTRASQAGVNVLWVLGYGNTAYGSTAWNYPPTNDSDYAAFCAAAAGRYGPGGVFWAANPTLTPVSTAFELWNEPYIPIYWGPDTSSSRYAAMALAAATAMHTAVPAATVLLSANYIEWRGDGLRYWANLVLDAQPTLVNAIDGYAVHGYAGLKKFGPFDLAPDGTGEVFYSIKALHDDLEQAGILKPIWLTEVGWSTEGNDANNTVTEAQQALFTTEAIVRCFQEWDWITKAFFYKYVEDTAADTVEDGFAWLNSDGTGKPVLGAVDAIV